jgi:hypothetical protein
MGLFPQLIRALYDAAPSSSKAKAYAKQQEYLKRVRALDYFEVRLGRAKREVGGKFKLKGVDALIAIDMLSKAYTPGGRRAR